MQKQLLTEPRTVKRPVARCTSLLNSATLRPPAEVLGSDPHTLERRRVTG